MKFSQCDWVILPTLPQTTVKKLRYAYFDRIPVAVGSNGVGPVPTSWSWNQESAVSCHPGGGLSNHVLK